MRVVRVVHQSNLLDIAAALEKGPDLILVAIVGEILDKNRLGVDLLIIVKASPSY